MEFAPAMIISRRKVLTAAKLRLISRNQWSPHFAPTGQWDSECLIARPQMGVHTPPVRLARSYQRSGGVTYLARRPVPPAPRWCGRSSNPQLSIRSNFAGHGRPAPDTAHANGADAVFRRGHRYELSDYRRPGHPGQGSPRQSPRCAWVGAAKAAPATRPAGPLGFECQGCLGPPWRPTLPDRMLV